MTAKFWVVQATAAALDRCEYPPGEKHALLVFTAAPDCDAALDLVCRSVAEHGWGDLEVMRSGEVTSDVSAAEDETLRAAAKGAITQGCHIVCYPQPLPGRERRHRN